MTSARRASRAIVAGAVLLALARTGAAQVGADGYGASGGAGGTGGGLVPTSGFSGYGGGLTGGDPGFAAGGGQARGGSVLPGVRTTLTVSDNLGLRRPGQEQAGFRTEVAPYVRASIANARVQGSLAYDLRAIYSHAGGDSSNMLRHDLNAQGNALLVDDWFGVQGFARSYRTSTTPFGTLGVDPATSSANTTRVSTVSMTPYVHGRTGTFADYRVQYTLTRSDVSGSAGSVTNRQSEQVLGSLTSGPQFNRWGWSLTANGARYEFGNGQLMHSTATVGTVYYVVGPELRLGLSANHLYIERLRNDKGENSGWGPGFSIDWAPSSRTTLRVNVADQYYGSSASVALAHRAQRWTFGLNYTRSVLSSNNAGVLALNLGDLLSGNAYSAALNPVFQQLVNVGVLDPNSTLIGAGVLSDALVRQRMLSATVGYVLPRGSLSLTAYRSVRETLLENTVFLPASDPLFTTAFGQYETRGGMLTLTVPFDSRTSAWVAGNIRDIGSLSTADRTRLSTLTASLRTQLDAKMGVTTGVRRTVQSGSGSTVGLYDENAVFGSFDVRF